MRNALNIYKRKDGRYEGRIPFGRNDNGSLKYKYFYSRDLNNLKEKMLSAYTSAEKYSEIACTKTISELCSEWLACAKLRVKHSSYCCYERNVRTHIAPFFKTAKYSELNSVKINTFIEYLINYGNKNGGGLSLKTVHDIALLLRSVAKYAESEYGYRNPMRNIITPKQDKSSTEVLDRTERQKLQLYLTNNLDKTNIGILLAMYTGMRIGELCAVTAEDIDIFNGVIHITKTIQRVSDNMGSCKTKVIVGSPKSKSSERDIPLPKFMIEILKNDTCTNGYLLSGTSKPVEPRTMQNRFKSVLKQCGIRNVNFHLLRHTYATVCIENGFDAKTVSELLGHSSVQITLNRYMHSSIEIKKRYVENLNLVS